MDNLPRHPGVGSPTSLIRCETDNPLQLAIVFFFPSGKSLSVVSDPQEAPIEPTLDAAKEWVTHIVDALLREGLTEDLERTNIASVVAATQRCIEDFNQTRRLALYQGTVQ